MEDIGIDSAQNILMSAPIGILILDAQNKIQWHNNALLDVLALKAEQIQQQSKDTLASDLRSVLINPPETVLLQQGDKQRWLRIIQQSNNDGSKVRYYMDISAEQRLRAERDKLADELQQLTTRDAITGLPNQRALLQGLDPLVSRSRRYGNPLTLIKLNLSINEDEGIPKASQHKAWIEVGQALKAEMRWADIIGRYHDASFLLILPETTAEAGKQLADKVSDLINALHIDDNTGKQMTLHSHCGVSAWEKGDDAMLMLKRADEKMNTAKQADMAVG